MEQCAIGLVAPADFARVELPLAELLADVVESGGAVSFMQPFSARDGLRFWREQVFPHVEAGHRLLFVASRADRLTGTVSLDIAAPPNQPHRGEVSKMMVHSGARRLGVGRMLMTRLEQEARALGKTLITLDTRTGDAAERLYASLGFVPAGTIPGYALDPDGAALHGTTYMYKAL